MSPDEIPHLEGKKTENGVQHSAHNQVPNQILQSADSTRAQAFETLRPIDSQAEELNKIISNGAPQIFKLLSIKGQRAFFPKSGILAQGAEAKGLDINATIGVGLNDDGTAMALNSILENFNLEPKESISYSPSYGQPELRELWHQEIKQQNPSLNPEAVFSKPIVVTGLTNGLRVASELFVNAGDQISITEDYWENYNLTFEEGSFGIIKNYPTFNESNGFNIAGLNSYLEEEGKKKIILLNYPNNPTGYTPTKTEADEIAKTILNAANNGKNITVILDDAYFGLAYEEDTFKESMFSKIADLHENVLAVLIKGESKEGYAYGLRAAGITFAYKGMTPEVATAFEDKAAGIVRGMESNCATASQFAIINSRKSPNYQKEKQENFDTLETRYQKIKELLKTNPHYEKHFRAMPFNSGYFMCIRPVSLGAEELRKTLIKNHSTGTINVDNRLIRVAFSSVPTEKLPEVFENIYQACESLS